MSGARLASVYGQLEAAFGNDVQAVKWYEKALQANRFDFRTRYKYSLALKSLFEYDPQYSPTQELLEDYFHLNK